MSEENEENEENKETAVHKEDTPVPFPEVINLNDADDTEVKLIDWAHAISVEAESPETRAVGRIIKAFVPAFCEVLRTEVKRHDSDVGNVLNGLVNVSGLFLSMAISGCVKPGQEETCINNALAGIDSAVRSRVFDQVRHRAHDGNAKGLAKLIDKMLKSANKEES